MGKANNNDQDSHFMGMQDFILSLVDDSMVALAAARVVLKDATEPTDRRRCCGSPIWRAPVPHCHVRLQLLAQRHLLERSSADQLLARDVAIRSNG